MNLLQNNLTFAILVTDNGWRTDLTARFCEYYCNKLNGNIDNIIIVQTIDDALESCKTDYLLIQSGGHLTFTDNFFTTLNECAVQEQDIVLGHITIDSDYVILDKQCIFVNMKLWNQYGKVKYNSHDTKNGPTIKVTVPSSDKFKPIQIQVDSTDRVFIPAECRRNGAALIITQLDIFNCATSLAFLDSTNFHLLDIQTPLTEINSETFYEKNYLTKVTNAVYSLDTDKWPSLSDTSIHTIIAPARGLKALNLADNYKAKHVIVYDNNEMSLELQRRIFNIKIPTLYGEIVDQFIKDYPDCNIIGELGIERHSVVTPFKGSVSFHKIDLFSYEIQNLIMQYDHTKSLIIDFSDIYTHPHNFYRRPLYQVRGLFSEVYSLLKSRTGPTHILGLAPGFQPMNSIKVNTDTSQFDFDLSTVQEDEFTHPIKPLFFTPTISKKDIVEDKWTAPNLLVVDSSTESITVEETPFALAVSLGYSKQLQLDAINNKPTGKIILSKQEVFADFIAIFEYTFDESGRWSFKLGTPNNSKRIEFSNGLSFEGFKKHLLNDMKINPAMASRYFLQ